MRGDVRDKLWRQLESEILLQRHKTVVRECRRNSLMHNNTDKQCPKPDLTTINEQHNQNFGDVRTVIVKRKPGQGLGISITVSVFNFRYENSIVRASSSCRVVENMVYLY